MISYARKGNTFEFVDGDEKFTFTIPKHPKQTNETDYDPLRFEYFLYDSPISSKDKRYIAASHFDKIYVFDRQTGVLTESKFKLKHDIFGEFRFDEHNRIYFINGNSILRWTVGNLDAEILYTLYRATHGPSDIGTSPSGRYVSFLKYRNDANYLYIYDTVTKECLDCKISVFHYAWLDETHIVYTKSGGVKVIDVETAKSKHIVKDIKAIIKRSSKQDADRVREFEVDPGPFVHQDFNLLGVRKGRVWFSLWVCDYDKTVSVSILGLKIPTKTHPEHKGIWSAEVDGSNVRFAYAAPEIPKKRIFLTEDERVALSDSGCLKIYNSDSETKFEKGWGLVRCFEALNR